MPPRKKISAAVRRKVAELAGHRCSYCRSPEWVGMPMVTEHIRPLAAGGSSAEGNLCLACYRCNEFKGARTSTIDPLTDEMVLLFNPRAQIWREHFAWTAAGENLIGLTPCGRATIAALRLNNAWLVRARRIWILAGLHPSLD